jgi:hypothetical protein
LLPELSVLRADAIRYASWQGGDCSLRGRKGRAACSIANQRLAAVGGSGKCERVETNCNRAKIVSGDRRRRRPRIRQCQAARTFRCTFYGYFFGLPQLILATAAITG